MSEKVQKNPHYSTKEAMDIFKDWTTPLYKKNCINWSGVTTDKKTPYIEVFSEMILEDLEKCFCGIERITRSSTYIQDHDGNTSDDKSEDSAEKIIAKTLYGKYIEGLGSIIDYEVPLKNLNNDKAGKIDLLAFDKASNTLSFIELKNENSTETLLRCICEIETYFRTIDTGKLKIDIRESKKIKELVPEIENTDPETIKIQKVVLIYEGSKPAKPLQEQDKYKNLFRLINELEIKIFCMESGAHKGQSTIAKKVEC